MSASASGAETCATSSPRTSISTTSGSSDFPDAQVHVFEPELRAALQRRTVGERGRYRVAQLAHRPRWATHALAGERWLGFDSVRVIGEDVALVPLVGHTRGHVGSR